MLGYKILYDRTTTANVVYVGKAAGGSSEDAQVWSIKKVSLDTSGNVTSIEWPEGKEDPSYAWTNRSTLEYE